MSPGGLCWLTTTVPVADPESSENFFIIHWEIKTDKECLLSDRRELSLDMVLFKYFFYIIYSRIKIEVWENYFLPRERQCYVRNLHVK